MEISSSIMWSECVGSSTVTNALIPVTGLQIPHTAIQLRTSGRLLISAQSHQIEPQTGQQLTDALIQVLEEILKGKLIFIPSNSWSAGFFPHLKVFQVHVHEFI